MPRAKPKKILQRLRKEDKIGYITYEVALKELERLNDEVTNLKAQLIKQKPLVSFAEQVAKSSELISFDNFVSLLNSQGIPITEHKFRLWLKDNSFMSLYSGVYQKFIDRGLFVNKEKQVATPYGAYIDIETYITGKGQIYFCERLRVEYKFFDKIYFELEEEVE